MLDFAGYPCRGIGERPVQRGERCVALGEFQNGLARTGGECQECEFTSFARLQFNACLKRHRGVERPADTTRKPVDDAVRTLQRTVSSQKSRTVRFESDRIQSGTIRDNAVKHDRRLFAGMTRPAGKK